MFYKYFALFLLLLFTQACSSEPREQSDLAMAKIAMESRDWFHAEHLLERYLNTSNNLEKRWDAWNALIKTNEYTGSHFGVLRLYYENMLQEFLDDDQKRKIILYDYAQLLHSVEDFETAIDMWNVYLSIDGLNSDEYFKATQKVIEIYLHTGQFDDAENALYNCLGLEISPEDSAICLYELADLKAGRGALKEAVDLAKQVLEVEAYAITRGQAAFLLGDIAEQEGKYEEALNFFVESKEFYPNVLAVENRIAYLDNLLKK